MTIWDDIAKGWNDVFNPVGNVGYNNPADAKDIVTNLNKATGNPLNNVAYNDPGPGLHLVQDFNSAFNPVANAPFQAPKLPTDPGYSFANRQETEDERNYRIQQEQANQRQQYDTQAIGGND